MLDQPITPYGTDEPEKLMEKFYNAGNEMLLTLRNYITNPDNRKKPRTWGSMEAAKMVGVSNPTFRKLLETHPDIKNKTLYRTFTIKPWRFWEWYQMIFHHTRFGLTYLEEK